MHGRDEYIQSNNVFSTQSPQLALHYVTASIPFVQNLDTFTRLRVDGDWNSLHLYHSWFLKHRHPVFCLYLFGRYFLRTISLFEFPQNINCRLVAGRKTSSVDSFSSSSLEIVAPSSSDVEFKYSWPIDGFIHQVHVWEILKQMVVTGASSAGQDLQIRWSGLEELRDQRKRGPYHLEPFRQVRKYMFDHYTLCRVWSGWDILTKKKDKNVYSLQVLGGGARGAAGKPFWSLPQPCWLPCGEEPGGETNLWQLSIHPFCPLLGDCEV